MGVESGPNGAKRGGGGGATSGGRSNLQSDVVSVVKLHLTQLKSKLHLLEFLLSTREFYDFFVFLFFFFFLGIRSTPSQNRNGWEGAWLRAKYEMCVHTF